ncbi:MAG: hypothetical protein H6Q14_2889 [Bacteroidetes bacterium]|nr:hypothetical protein [Bacteroidota bacterium]
MKTNIRLILFLCLSFLLGIVFEIGHKQLKKANTITEVDPRDEQCELEMFYEFCEPNPLCNPYKDVVINGSKVCYDSLHSYYSKIGFYKILPLALIMANKFDYTQAYFDVYFSLYKLNSLGENKSTRVNDWSLDKLDKKTQGMAIEYLKIAADKGYEQAKKILGLYRKEGRYIDKNE